MPACCVVQLLFEFSSAKGKHVDWLGMSVDNARVIEQLKEGNAALLWP